ncbi:hypothetical protein GCM10023322_01590 [Rugosimonospora acidiphila]|uniref:Secreted protein n=1 Tax=Rugosimonospora acidiphila TaxID=556531 RepID=A0ABP9RH31_9ACTN
MRRSRQSAMALVKRTTTWLAVTVAAVAAATVVTAGPSFAVSPTSATATASVGYAYFNADTQVLSIHDSHADGYGIAVINYRYDLANIGPYYGWNREGSGTTTYYYLHMPPLGEIKFYVCPEQNGVVIEYECGSRAFGYAGTEI